MEVAVDGPNGPPYMSWPSLSPQYNNARCGRLSCGRLSCGRLSFMFGNTLHQVM